MGKEQDREESRVRGEAWAGFWGPGALNWEGAVGSGKGATLGAETTPGGASVGVGA